MLAIDRQWLTLHPDRALPAEPCIRAVARRLYAQTRGLPLVCMHGHVEAATFLADEPFPDPSALLVTPDHYVTRMLVSQGASPADLGVCDAEVDGSPVDSREIWRRFCTGWKAFRGTPSRFWLEHALVEVLGVDLEPGPDTADDLYDAITARLAEPAMRPRALLQKFGIETLATTDVATADLSVHHALAAEGLATQIVPTFRPDALTRLSDPEWSRHVRRLGEQTDTDVNGLGGLREALRRRRTQFIAAGGLATDHGHLSVDTTLLSDADADAIVGRALAGTAEEIDTARFAGHFLHLMAELSAEDGLVLQIHPGVLRDYDTEVARRYGPDQGFDIPVGTEFTRSLQPMLSRLGHQPGLRIVLFTVDETTYSRELAPLAGVYPSVRLGAPWWFLDSPDGMRRFRELVTETAGFYNTAGFVDDTRAFMSIPARHDLARRIDAGYLGRLVAEHRLTEDEAVDTAVDLAYHLPRETYGRTS